MTLHNHGRMTQETQVRGCRLCHIMEFCITEILITEIKIAEIRSQNLRSHTLRIIAPSPLSPLLDAFEQQDELFAPAFLILQEAIVQRGFPAATVAVTYNGRLVCLKAFGRFTYELNSPTATAETLFDLASLTKVVATSSMAMLLYERGLLDLEAAVAAVVPEFAADVEKDPPPPRRHVSPASRSLVGLAGIREVIPQSAYSRATAGCRFRHASHRRPWCARRL